MSGAVRACFPFGRPNSVRPMRMPSGGAPTAVVVGVYPSAFHMAWSPPTDLDPRPGERRGRALIGSLAVDVEPVVFWGGSDPSPAELLEQWTAAVGFDLERHGQVRPGHNGPSGAGLIDRVLTPLGSMPDRVAVTDAVPWYFTKTGTGSQGDAITQRFAPGARSMGVHEGSLPFRPAPRWLARLAVRSDRRDSLRAELLDAGAPVVNTLGQEALDVIAGSPDDSDGHQTRLTPDGYGAIGSVRIDGRPLRLLPLAHPGFLHQTARTDWRDAFTRFEQTAPDLLDTNPERSVRPISDSGLLPMGHLPPGVDDEGVFDVLAFDLVASGDFTGPFAVGPVLRSADERRRVRYGV